MKLSCSKVLSGILALIIASVSTVQAQELQDFLDCADYSDRIERVFCLENALDEALADGVGSSENIGDNRSIESVGNPEISESLEVSEKRTVISESSEAEPSTVNAEVRENSRFRLPSIRGIFSRDKENDASAQDQEDVADVEQAAPERLESFGRPTRVVVNENGEDELVDVVAGLREIKPNTLLIELTSGQVWRQTHVRRYNLREGNEVRIYPTGWGEKFRLETSRLSGFIQVERVE